MKAIQLFKQSNSRPFDYINSEISPRDMGLRFADFTDEQEFNRAKASKFVKASFQSTRPDGTKFYRVTY